MVLAAAFLPAACGGASSGRVDLGHGCDEVEVRFDGRTWASPDTSDTSALISEAHYEGISGTFEVDGDVASFTADDGRVLPFQPVPESDFQKLACWIPS